ncbi:MAG TPA: hypothetical protein PL143_17965 [Rhodocyclaceae bacterium]|nr:hypothetical protein [Rhodocyclaceae bacterium]
MRGFTAAALIAAVRTDKTDDPARRMRSVLRAGLLGGGSMAAGSAVVDAVEQGRWGSALAALAVGTAGLLAVERLLDNDTDKEQADGQETQEG